MRKLLAIIGLILIPLTAQAVTLTSDTTYDVLIVGSGAELISDGYEITVRGTATGGTICYGTCDFRAGTDDSTLFTQIDNDFVVSTGSGELIFSGTGRLLLTGTGSSSTSPYELTVQSGALSSLTIDNGLVGYWRLDEGFGSGVNLIISENAPLLNSARYYATGFLKNTSNDNWIVNNSGNTLFRNPYAFNFDGVNAAISVDVNYVHPVLNDVSPLTISAWIHPRGLGEGNLGSIVDKAFLIFRLTAADSGGDGNLTFIRGHATDLDVDSTGDPINFNTWQHVAVTWDGGLPTSSVKMYVNGTEVSYGAATAGVGALDTDVGEELVIGNSDGRTNAFDGLIDDVRFYNRALSHNEIQDLANGKQATGSGYYILNENLDVRGSVGIYSGTLDNNEYGLTLSGSWINHGGYVGSGGLVDFGGIGHKVMGNTNFESLIKTGTFSGSTVDFKSGQQIARVTAQTAGTEVVSFNLSRTGSQVTNQEYIVIGSWGIGGEDVSAAYAQGEIYVNGAAQNDAEGIEYYNDGTIFHELVMSKITLDSTSHNFMIKLINSSDTASDEAIMEGANLVAFERPKDMVWAEDLTQTTDTDSDSAWDTNKLFLEYEAFGEDVLIVATADVEWQDTGDPGGVRLLHNGVELMRQEESNRFDSLGNNDNRYHPVSFVRTLRNVSGVNRVVMQLKDGGAGDGGAIKNARMFALPLGAFWHVVESSTDDSEDGTTYVDMLTESTGYPAGNYVAFFGTQHGTNTTAFEADLQVKAPTADSYEIMNAGDSIYNGSDNAENPWSGTHMWAKTLSAGAGGDWQLEWNDGSGTAYGDRNSMAVIQMGSDKNALSFDFRSGQNFSGSLVVMGDENIQSTLRTTKSGSVVEFNLDAQTGSGFLTRLDVFDNDASNGRQIVCGQYGVVGDTCTFKNTTNWNDTLASEAGVIILKLEDEFTLADESALENWTPSSGTGTGYVLRTGETKAFNASAAYDTAMPSACGYRESALYTLDADYPTDNYFIETEFPALIGYQRYSPYIIARYTDTSNYYALECWSRNCQLYKNVAGSWSTLGSQITNAAIANGVYIYLRADGSTISWGIGRPSLDADGTVDCADGDACTELVSVTDSSHASGTAGIGAGRLRTTTHYGCMNYYNRFDNIRLYELSDEAAPPAARRIFFIH